MIGTSLFQIIFVASNTTILQASQNQTVDIILALLLLIGSVIGVQIGSKFSNLMKDLTIFVEKYETNGELKGIYIKEKISDYENKLCNHYYNSFYKSWFRNMYESH